MDAVEGTVEIVLAVPEVGFGPDGFRDRETPTQLSRLVLAQAQGVSEAFCLRRPIYGRVIV